MLYAPKQMAAVTDRRYNWLDMSDSNENPRSYKWPWLLLAMVLIGIISAILWMSFAVHRERQERDFNAPIPNSAK
jgi:hypothetical protein